MQSKILKAKIVVCAFVIALSISNCTKKTDLENQITVKINSIDSETKQRRVNAFDTVEVRIEGIGYLMKTFSKVGEYIIDSTGSVKIKIDCTEGYTFTVFGPNLYGSERFTKKEKLKDGQEINIQVIHLEKR